MLILLKWSIPWWITSVNCLKPVNLGKWQASTIPKLSVLAGAKRSCVRPLSFAPYHIMAMSMEQDPENVASLVSYLFHPIWYLGLSNDNVVNRSECLTVNGQLSMNILQHVLSWSHCIGYWDMFNFSCWKFGRTRIPATEYQLLISTSGVFSSPGSSVLQFFEGHECQNTTN